jgi:hypothetical protein
MYEKYKAEQEKAAKEKTEKEKTEKEKIEKEKVEKTAVGKEKVENEKAPVEATPDDGSSLTDAAAQAAALVQGLNGGGSALPPGTHEEVSGWADDKNGKSRLTYVKDASGNVVGGYTTHFDANGKEIGREEFKSNPAPESGAAEPDTSESGSSESDAVESDTSESDASESSAVESDTSESGAPVRHSKRRHSSAPRAEEFVTPTSTGAGTAPSPKETLKTIDESIVKIEAALSQYDAQIAAIDAMDGPAESKAASKETLMAYRPMITEQLEKLKAMRQEKVLQGEKWTDSGK